MVAALETTRALLINLLRIQYWPNTNKKKSIVMDIVDDTDSFFFFLNDLQFQKNEIRSLNYNCYAFK